MNQQQRGKQQGTRDRRQGRGHISSFDTLPEDADEALFWANQQLRDRAMPQTEILLTFNAMLADKGIKGVSKSAFSRYSVRKAIEERKQEAGRQIADIWIKRMPLGERNDSTIAAIEMLKFRILTMVADTDEPDLKLFGEAALALNRLSSTALREAEGQRRDKADEREESKLAQAEREKLEQAENAATAATVEQIASEAGLSAERVAAIRKGVLGLSA